jgi:hypothetical protein
MKKRTLSLAFIFGLLICAFGLQSALAGTASASATAKAGDDCGEVSKKSGQNTGAMTVDSVTVNGTTLKKDVDYTVENDGSTRPKIKFKNPLAKGDKVDVTLTTGKTGHFDVNLTLSDC